MKLYVISEIFEIEDGYAHTTTNNHVRDKSVAFNMYLTRREMMLKTYGVRVIKDDYSEEENWGFTKVMLENGNTIEIGISALELI